MSGRGNYNYRSNREIIEAAKYIEYDPQTGSVTRIGQKRKTGSIDAYGYLIIKIKGINWKAHRLAWTKYYGYPPINNIDHIDGVRTNNSILNLRDAPQSVNVWNTKRLPNEDTGVVGIHLDRSTRGLKAKFTTRVNGKTKRFLYLRDAIAYRQEVGL